MASHTASAVDWNGKDIEITFRASGERIEKLAKAAHEAFHRDGKWTIQLGTVDGIEVPVELRYSK